MLPRSIVVVLLLVSGLSASDWPQWRGVHRDGKSPETGLLKQWPMTGPKLVWNSREVNMGIGIGTGYSSVSVADGRIYTMGDRSTSKDAKAKKAPKGEGTCFVIALEEATGKELWATAVGPAGSDGPRCTPTVDGDRIFALGRYGDLVCLEAATGKLVWRKHFGKDFGGRMMSGWDYSESPLVDGDKLICTPGADTAAIVALNKKNGDVIWKSAIPKCGGAGYASVVIANVGGIKQYITLLGKSKGVVGVDANTGKFLWNYAKVANGTANIPTSIVKGDLVFCTTGYLDGGSALLKLVPKDGGITAQEIYYHSSEELQNHHGGVVLVGEHLYGGHGHNDGQPFCMEMKTGRIAWKESRGAGSGSAAVVYADGHLYFRYQNATMALIEASPMAYRLRSHFSLPNFTGSPSWHHPAIANGKLYIRGRDVLLCYDVKE